MATRLLVSYLTIFVSNQMRCLGQTCQLPSFRPASVSPAALHFLSRTQRFCLLSAMQRVSHLHFLSRTIDYTSYTHPAPKITSVFPEGNFP